MPNTAPAPADQPTPPPRMVSIDALRGFDMFWIIGGEQLARALEPLGGSNGFLSGIATQLKHVEWEGFHFYDGIFPLFLFLIGVSIVLSLDRMIATAGFWGSLGRIARRSMLLFAVGVFYYGGVSRTWPDVQVSGVLPRIALCYLAAASLYVCLPRKAVGIAAAALLAGYWALLSFVPFPDLDLKHATIGKKGSQLEAKAPEELLRTVSDQVTGKFEEGRNLAHYVDFKWLPGRKGNLYYTNEGLLSTLPAVATTLFGILAAWVLKHGSWTDYKKVVVLVTAGIAAMGLGFLWGIQFPVIKRIWTSSFCLVSGGFASILLGIFYLVVDVWQWRRWCRPFLWIGSNALVAYLAVNLVDFKGIATRLVGGDIQQFLDVHLPQGSGGLLVALVALSLPVLLVRFLHQRKIFVRL